MIDLEFLAYGWFGTRHASISQFAVEFINLIGQQGNDRVVSLRVKIEIEMIAEAYHSTALS